MFVLKDRWRRLWINETREILVVVPQNGQGSRHFRLPCFLFLKKRFKRDIGVSCSFLKRILVFPICEGILAKKKIENI